MNRTVKMTQTVAALLLTYAWIVGGTTRPLQADECITGFSVVTSELVVPGKTTAVFLTLNHPTGPTRPSNVTLRLFGPDNVKLIEIDDVITGHGIVTFRVPNEASGTCALHTLIDCATLPDATNSLEDGDDHCELKSVAEVRVVGRVREIIVRPAKHSYRPEEIVTFWTLALDHDLQVATGTIGTISVQDPQGTKVAVWDQVTFDDGVVSYSVPLSVYALIGRWTIAAEVDQSQFVASFDVTPGIGIAALDVSVAEEHYVELKFGNGMRRRYKPGLPFAGKVEAMSTEKSVRVRVKVYDNTTAIYSQDIEISNGEGTFLVPAILADSDVIHLQAELVSVESKEIESHYVLAREPIRKWNSSSDCYLLIEGVEHTLQPNEEAHVTVLSTCPCENDVHYVITTDGRITDWSRRAYDARAPPIGLSNTCKMNFTFVVQPIMAPISQLLVYHVTAQGEPISDVISFDVRLFDKQVLVNIEARDWWLPDQSIDLELIAPPSSLVCLLGGRSETSENRRFDPTVSEEPSSITSSMTNQVDFLEAGVSYFQRECAKRGNGGRSAILYRQSGSGAGPTGLKRRTPESLVGGSAYGQLWMWRCFNYSSATELSITAPAQPGKWSAWALTVTRAGIRFSAPVIFHVFRPLTVDFRLPRTLKVGEIAEVDIKIGNNVNSCVDVTALLALSEGAKFQSNNLLYVTERLRLGPHGATSLVVKIVATTQGRTNLTVEVNGYASSTCEGLENPNNASLSGAVLHSAILTVLPEGRASIRTENSYFCANERLVVSTGDQYQYEWIAAPKNQQSVVVEVRTSSGPVHVGLADKSGQLDKMYSITIGDVSYVSRGKHHFGIRLASNHTPGILAEDTWTAVWIAWTDHVIAVGRGPRPHGHVLLRWPIDKRIEVAQIGFGAGRGVLAQFRIWNYNEEAGFSQVMRLTVPERSVPGTERARFTVTGGLALTTVTVSGGGLSGAVAALLDHRGIDSPYLGHIQTVLSYRKPDGSFGEHPMFGSHKATVTVLTVLGEIQAYANIDPDVIESIKRWVQLRQEDDGRFTPLQADQPIESGSERVATGSNTTTSLENVVEMTAVTVIALYEIGIETDTDSDTIEKAKIFLENSLPKVELPETMAAVTLALVLVKSATAAWAVEKLRNASTTEDGEFGWSRGAVNGNAAEWLYEARSDETSSLAVSGTVEQFRASLHALATFCLIGDVKTAQSVVRFVVARAQLLDSHYELLYATSKAFKLYNSMESDEHRLVTVSLATSGMELTETIVLDKDRQSAVLHLPTMPTKVFVYATGAGCATIQGITEFSTFTASERTALLEIRAEIVEEITADHSSLEEIDGKLPSLKIRTCLRWKGDRPSPVIRMEHALFSGFELTAPPPQLEGQHYKMAEMQHGHHGNAVWFVLANVTSPCAVCVRFHARPAHVISGLRPAYAQAYPVGRPDLMVATFYHVTARGSRMLNAVSDDDLVTWLGGERARRPLAACAPTENATERHQVARVNTPAPPNQYVLLNKQSLWDLIKEAVNDDVKRKELSNMLRETDD